MLDWDVCRIGPEAPSGGARERIDDIQHCTVSRCHAAHGRL